MRKSILFSAAAVTLVVLTSGCARDRLGRGGPDEFAVARQAPLVIPPDYSLTPPRPGAARANDTSANAQALDALFGGRAQRSAGEAATLTAAGDESEDPGIRSTVGDPATTMVDKGTATRDVVAAPEGDGQNAKASAPK